MLYERRTTLHHLDRQPASKFTFSVWKRVGERKNRERMRVEEKGRRDGGREGCREKEGREEDCLKHLVHTPSLTQSLSPSQWRPPLLTFAACQVSELSLSYFASFCKLTSFVQNIDFLLLLFFNLTFFFFSRITPILVFIYFVWSLLGLKKKSWLTF